MSGKKLNEIKPVVAKDKEDLIKIIEDTINKDGNYSDLNFIDVSYLTDLSGLFSGEVTRKFNGNISEWDVSSVTDMRFIFAESMFNGDISKWDVSSVTDMREMFYFTVGFDGDISKWNVSSVTDMSKMFAFSRFNGDISKWDVSKVGSMSGMFWCAESFNQPLDNWDLSRDPDGTEELERFRQSKAQVVEQTESKKNSIYR